MSGILATSRYPPRHSIAHQRARTQFYPSVDRCQLWPPWSLLCLQISFTHREKTSTLKKTTTPQQARWVPPGPKPTNTSFGPPGACSQMCQQLPHTVIWHRLCDPWTIQLDSKTDQMAFIPRIQGFFSVSANQLMLHSTLANWIKTLWLSQ